MLVRRSITRQLGARVVYHAVPSHLAANKERAEAFRVAWSRYVGPGAPLYAQEPRTQAILEIQRGADPFEVTTKKRTFWR